MSIITEKRKINKLRLFLLFRNLILLHRHFFLMTYEIISQILFEQQTKKSLNHVNRENDKK